MTLCEMHGYPSNFEHRTCLLVTGRFPTCKYYWYMIVCPSPKTISKFNPSRIGNVLAQANTRSTSFEVMLKDLIVNPMEKDTSIYNIYIYIYIYIFIYLYISIYLIYIYISNIYLYIHRLPHQYIPTLSNSKSSPKWTEERCGLSKC